MEEFKKVLINKAQQIQRCLSQDDLLRKVDLTSLSDKELLEYYEVLVIAFNKITVTQEAFNKITNLRAYLLNSPKDYTQECLHYLGDAAQKWWFEKKFTEGYERVMDFINSDESSKAFEEYLKFETVEIYRKIALELKEQYDSSYSEAEQELIGSGFLSILSLSKRHHLKTEL